MTHFQDGVDAFMHECFGPVATADRPQRAHRFLEEALELFQAVGCSRDEAYQLVDYVFSRPVGEKTQEVGGVMVTLAALCNAWGFERVAGRPVEIDIETCAEKELARCWTVIEKIREKHKAKPKFGPLPGGAGRLTLDTPNSVYFYEQEFYPFSNFSSFKVNWMGVIFDTSEHAYHWSRFLSGSPERQVILDSASAHDAFRFAQENKAHQWSNWDAIKVGVMREILRAKAAQHEYVRRKLLETGERLLVENSWRDPYWGWGPNRDGLNMLGKLWMEVRAEFLVSSGVGVREPCLKA